MQPLCYKGDVIMQLVCYKGDSANVNTRPNLIIFAYKYEEECQSIL